MTATVYRYRPRTLRALVQLLEYETIEYNRQMEMADMMGLVITDRRMKPENYILYSERVRNIGKAKEPEKTGRDVLEDTKSKLIDRIKGRSQ